MKHNKLFFSVILPTFNRADFLTESILSVIAQTYNNWELIIVDDGSTDNTKKLVNKYCEIDYRIKYFYQENSERSAARNFGTSKAKGNWVCFLDSDDKFHKSHLEEFHKLITENNFQEGLYFCDVKNIVIQRKNFKHLINLEDKIEFLLLNSFATPQACIPIGVINKFKFNENIINGEDRELWIRIVKQFDLYFTNNKTLLQTEHAKRSINLGLEKEGLETLKLIINQNKNFINKNIQKTVVSNFYFRVAKSFIKRKKPLNAIIYLVISILNNFNNKQTRHKLALFLSLLNIYREDLKNDYL